MVIDINILIADILKGGRYEQFIIEANQSQLADYGQDVKGRDIKTFKARGGQVYADYTIKKKQKIGQPTDHVTAFSSGKLYDSFITKAQKTFAEVTANKKSLAQFFENVDKSFDILGLNEENTDKLAAMLQVDLQKDIDLFIEKTLQI